MLTSTIKITNVIPLKEDNDLPYFRFIYLSIWLLTLSSCTSTKVHLYSSYLTDEETSNISQHLSEAGFTVIPNQLKFPPSVNSNAIIYSPVLKDISKVTHLAEVLQTKDISVTNLIPMTADNHWYTSDSMALFVIPEGVNHMVVNKRDLAQKYLSANCEREVFLVLREDGSFSFFGETWNKKQQQLAEGNWRYKQFPYLEFVPDNGNWTTYFTIEIKTVFDQIGKVTLYQLSPSSRHPIAQQCIFEFGIRG